ncbi:hypothetical protein Q0590_12995 [Rhodocytophaga aerolata]|uniref:Matrixin family metalloprotease n=1 Tax=Rhodocytophaga aerolata TaxID=455078 RepID=A0ABT8R512_9BACT|nr:hypothetical protein [Rhodocytophaga aerolata]MDO1447179.1 hypothetical protein [Rhodocytophaga aerolata]
MNRKQAFICLFAMLFCFSCEKETSTIEKEHHPAPADANARISASSTNKLPQALASINSSLTKQKSRIRVLYAEYLTSPDGKQAGQIVYANDRQKRLTTQWVPNDPNRFADGNNITYLVDKTYQTANKYNSAPDFNAAPEIDAAMSTWNTSTNCSDLPIVKRTDNETTNPNYVLQLFASLGAFNGLAFLNELEKTPANPFVADIVNTGFIPFEAFEGVFGPADAPFVLAVCWTLTFVDENGQPLDADRDGYVDTALKEVWYNDGFAWSNTGAGNTIDVQTVALHENGHALEMGHFGKIFETSANGKLHFAPRTVMNASYSGVQRQLDGSALGAHCSIFGSWPNK